MDLKYKISDLAKDLNMQTKELLDVVAEKTGEQKKTNSSLTEQQLNLVLEKLTKEKEVASFDEYLDSGKPQPQAKPQAKPQPNKPKSTGNKYDKALETMSREAAESMSGTRPPQPKNQPAKQNNAQKPQQPQQPKPQAKPQQKPVISNEPLKRADGSIVEVKKPKQDKKGEKVEVEKREFVRVTVDTKTSDVNLDKFNEKYTELAQQRNTFNGRKNKNGVGQGKQKFGKNKFNRNQQGGFSKKKETEAERLQRIQLEKARKAQLEVAIPDEISVSELATRLKTAATNVIKKLMGLGVMASLTEIIDFDTASLVAEELGAKVEREVRVTIEEQLFNEVVEDSDENLEERPPVVVVMGHVDHGKTSILDAIRKANVTSVEAGGITQHIGAYQVTQDGKVITFLDTPGHEAFTSMRARGANLTDIAVLVVAADDGIMPQTIESINHAKAAGVQIIVAINKMDKPTANPDKVKEQLTNYEIVTEEWGGDTICVPVSAVTGEGIDTLLEMINLTSEVAELKANPNRRAKGAVIEARLDKGQGPIATILVQNGTLNKGDVIIAGTCVGRIRTMRDGEGKPIEVAGPSTPVEITGLTEVPVAGDLFDAVEDERLARELAEQRQTQAKEEIFKTYQKVTLDNLFSHIEDGKMKELCVVVKADVQGSAEAVKQSLEKLTDDEVRVKVIHAGVGAVTKSDIMLASASNAIIIGFNVRPDPVAKQEAEIADVEMRMYRVIYDAINDIKDAMKGLLDPKIREVEQGRIEVRSVFKISSAGTIAGCYVLDGKVTRSSKIRLVRDGIVITEDEIDSLRRFKDDVKDVARGFECGIGLVKFADIKEGDIFEAYILEEYRD